MTGAPFQPGDVVCCVDVRPGKYGMAPSRLQRGALYRVSDISRTGRGINLVGIDPAPAVGFLASRFRKIDDEVEESFRLMLRSLKNKSPAASSPAGSEDVCPRNARTSSPHIPEAGLRRPPAAPVDHRAAPFSNHAGKGAQ